LYESKEKIDYQKLLYYLNRNEGKATKKRFLFLVELLGLTWTNHYDEMLNEMGTSFVIQSVFANSADNQLCICSDLVRTANYKINPLVIRGFIRQQQTDLFLNTRKKFNPCNS